MLKGVLIERKPVQEDQLQVPRSRMSLFRPERYRQEQDLVFLVLRWWVGADGTPERNEASGLVNLALEFLDVGTGVVREIIQVLGAQ